MCPTLSEPSGQTAHAYFPQAYFRGASVRITDKLLGISLASQNLVLANFWWTDHLGKLLDHFEIQSPLAPPRGIDVGKTTF
jgi:hypothetical protein